MVGPDVPRFARTTEERATDMMQTACKSNGADHPSQSGAPHRLPRLIAATCLVLVTGIGCGVGEILLEPFRGETPRERYEEALDRAGLGDSHMVRAWISAGSRAFDAAVETSPPLIEEVWLPPGEPSALAYRIRVDRGQRIRVELEPDVQEQAIFVELFRMRGENDADRALLVRWTEDGERELVYDARASASYVLVIQPELLGGGPLRVHLGVGPSLAFPVQDRSTGNIGSFFGDIRDGGARDHHGVDIFAPRGTPVLAATDGVAYRVGVNRLGGNVVWVRDPTGDVRQYYAHLDVQLVEQGAQVQIGDTLGLVGNTGNAITTPPHLHFGIYLRGDGPVDPMPFLRDPGGTPALLAVSREAFDQTWAVKEAGAALHLGPTPGTAAPGQLGAGLPVRIVGGTGQWWRVRTPSGEEGYVRAAALEPSDYAINPELRVALTFPGSPMRPRSDPSGHSPLEAQE